MSGVTSIKTWINFSEKIRDKPYYMENKTVKYFKYAIRRIILVVIGF